MKKLLAAAFVASALLAGCGGGGGPGLPATSTLYTSASASVSGFIEYLMELVKSDTETDTPVSITGLTPPTSETTEPVALR